ncbi:MAG: aminopeptidase P family protein [Thermotogaceae bacterium]|nr:aminopeptidase P family protein [Thermotogaceae bacterium]
MKKPQRLLNLVRTSINSHIDTIMIWNYENSSRASTTYLSGFKGSFSVLILRDDGCYIVTDSRYFEQAENETDFILIKHSNKTLADTVSTLLKELSAKVVGFEAQRLDFKSYSDLIEKLDVEFVAVDNAIHQLRSVKTEGEIESIRKASKVAEQAFLETLKFIKEGVTEAEICAELEYRIKKLGGHIGFETLVGSGPRTSMPHVKPTNKQVKNGELILFDFGARVDEYCCDITRMVALGNPSGNIKECYLIVKQSLEKATETGKAGMVGKQVDSAARKVVQQSKYSEFCFKYGLGHGIGLEVHEEPRLSPQANAPLSENAVVTIEPGIYIPGEFGIRIENDVVVGNSSFETITTLSEDLIVL